MMARDAGQLVSQDWKPALGGIRTDEVHEVERIEDIRTLAGNNVKYSTGDDRAVDPIIVLDDGPGDRASNPVNRIWYEKHPQAAFGALQRILAFSHLRVHE